MDKSRKKSLGIIGFGQFAQFIIPYLKPYFSDIVVASRSDKKKIADRLGIGFVSAQEAASKDIVMLAMPISEIVGVLRQIRKNIKAGVLVFDVCSVKAYPVKMMKKFLPRSAKILGTHPLFGPQSGKNGIKGLDIVLCPVRIKAGKLADMEKIFTAMGLHIIPATPENHDRTMAYSQALTHFFAKAFWETAGRQKFPFVTPSAGKLMAIFEDIRYDSPRLFADMQALNPYARRMRQEVIRSLTKVNKNLILLKNSPSVSS